MWVRRENEAATTVLHGAEPPQRNGNMEGELKPKAVIVQRNVSYNIRMGMLSMPIVDGGKKIGDLNLGHFPVLQQYSIIVGGVNI